MKQFGAYIWFYFRHVFVSYAILLPLAYILLILVGIKNAVLDNDYIISDALDNQARYNKRLLDNIKRR